ncbi:unnamed protein product, partial [Brenthis ino]
MVIVTLLFNVPSVMVIIYEILSDVKMNMISSDECAMRCISIVSLMIVIFAPSLAASSLPTEVDKIRITLHNSMLEENDVETQSKYNQNEGSLPRSVLIDDEGMERDIGLEAVDIPQIDMGAPGVASYPELTFEYLQALGDAVDEVPQYGEEIHSNLAQRWLPLPRKDLPKNTRDLIFKPYITCTKALTLFLTGGDQIQSIKILSDASRILCDLHYQNTETRIKLLTPSLVKSLLNVIENNHDETVFGANLSGKTKAAKIIEKQGLSPVKKPSIFFMTAAGKLALLGSHQQSIQ